MTLFVFWIVLFVFAYFGDMELNPVSTGCFIKKTEQILFAVLVSDFRPDWLCSVQLGAVLSKIEQSDHLNRAE